MLSVVMPCRDAEPHLESAVRSVLNQDLRDLELIVVDDGSSDGSSETLGRLASRDRRIRLMRTTGASGPGAARNLGVSAVRGKFLAFADADDVVLPGSYSALISSLRRTSSDMAVGGYRRHGAQGEHRPRLVQAVHETDVLATDAEAFPQLADEVVVWNRVYRTSFWRSAVGGFPEDVNYEDREPALRSMLAARRFDVLAQDVYSWRLAGDGTSRSQNKHRPEDIRDRLRVLVAEAELLVGAPANVVARVRRRWLGVDLTPYVTQVPMTGDDYWFALQDLVRQAARGSGSESWSSLGVQERLVAHVIVNGSRTDVEELLGTRAEDTGAVPVVWRDGCLMADLEVVDRLETTVPADLLVVQPESMHLDAGALRASWAGGSLVVEAWALVPGLDPGTPGLQLHVDHVVGSEHRRLEATSFFDRRVDVIVADPWRSYASSAFVVELRPMTASASSEELRLTLVLDGATWSTGLKIPVPPKDSSLHTPHEAGTPSRLVVEDVQIERGTLTIDGRVTRRSKSVRVGITTSRRRFESAVSVSADGTFRARIRTDAAAFPADGYFVRWTDGADGELDKWARPGRLLREGAIDRTANTQRATIQHQGDAVSVTIGPPLDLAERSRFGQRSLRGGPGRTELVRSVLFETFNGKSCGDNPGALFHALRVTGVDADLYWSVRDHSVPVPEGGIPLVIGSAAWHEQLSRASVLVNNNNFPHWFEKRPGQFYLQTWHGTPIKKLLWDLEPQRVPLTYRRLMRRQVPMWDLLLAQSERAAVNLRSGLGYDGEVLIMEQPRNRPLIDPDEEGRRAARESLGIEQDARVVLYAPTWREAQRIRSRASTWVDQIDASSIARTTGARVLLRGHHVAGYAPAHDTEVHDVSEHDSIEDLMLAADVLVSDYSSVLYDWRLTGRPAVVHVPDLDHYRDDERGFYEDWPSTSPWPVTRDTEELLGQLGVALRGQHEPTMQTAASLDEGVGTLVERILVHVQKS